MIDSQQVTRGRNCDYAWDAFGAKAYFEANYINLRDDDQKILEYVQEFFAGWFEANPPTSGIAGIDVGTGPNLYPALTMLPFCEKITLFEFSAANVAWLEKQKNQNWPSWDEAWVKFWDKLSQRESYRSLTDPQAELRKRVSIEAGDVFKLPSRAMAQSYDVGTMFFVAESITGQRNEFTAAVDDFFAVLKPGAPFAMAFMEHSDGYRVGDERYPATDIDRADVSQCLRDRALDLTIHTIDWGLKPLRAGYKGMILALGRVKRHGAERATEEID